MDHSVEVTWRWPLLLALASLLVSAPAQGQRGNVQSEQLKRKPLQRELPGPGETLAGRFLSRRHLPGGGRSSGRVGDYFVRSRKLLAVIDANRGRLLDLALAPEFDDILGWDSIAVCDGRGRHTVHPTSIEIESGRRPAIRVRGLVRQGRHRLAVQTELHIPAEASHLELTTTLHNLDRNHIWSNVEVCDQLGNGNVPLWLPGVGTVTRSGRYSAAFCSRTEAGLTTLLALPPKARPMRLQLAFAHPVPAFEPTVNVGYGRENIMPGQRSSVRRQLFLVRGGAQRAVARWLETNRRRRWRVKLTLPSAEHRAVVRRRGKPYLLASGNSRELTLALPPDAYTVAPLLAGAGEGQPVTLPPGSKQLALSGPAAATLELDARVDGASLPVTFTVDGVGKTSRPSFGRGGGVMVDNAIYSRTGRATATLAPGRYRVSVSRGPDYSRKSSMVTLRSGRKSKLRLQLRRLLPSRGWAAVDLHVHTAASFDSPVTLAQRVVAAGAVGLDLIAITDHNAVSSAVPPSGAGLPAVVMGQEVTTEGNPFGHFNVLPLKRRLRWWDTAPRRLFRRARRSGKDVLIQVNHPRMGGIGYFDQMELDASRNRARSPGYDAGYHLLEVYNGDRLDQPQQMWRVVRDWFALLNTGSRYVATAGSDSHRLPLQETGMPRTLVLAEGWDGKAAPEPRMVLGALRKGRAVVSTGPRVELTANGEPVGSWIKTGGKTVKLQLRVQAAPGIDLRQAEVWQNGVRSKTLPLRGRGLVRLDHHFSLTPTRDTWVAVVVRGERPEPHLLRKVKPFAVTNPIWLDTDSDGSFTAVPLGQK